MPDLPIHPQRRESPGYTLDRRLAKLHEAPREAYAPQLESLRLDCARETLRLTGAAEEAEDETLIGLQLRAIAAIEAASGEASTPTSVLIRQVHELANPGADGALRTLELPPQFANARASDPRFIGAKLDNLIDWLASETGSAMFPAERMALWFGRFLDIAPFTRGNFRTAHLFLNHFAAHAGYPLMTLTLDEAEPVRREVERALMFDTAPLVDRFTEALSRSLARCERAVDGDPEK